LKQVVLAQSLPTVAVLTGGLDILRMADLRQPLTSLNVPFFRLYGALDGLVPRKVVALLDDLWPQSQSHIIAKAAHAPFISHPDEFCRHIIDFVAA
jgi:pimeloyl-[acyl-carrier protein] methyl ester esterase